MKSTTGATKKLPKFQNGPVQSATNFRIVLASGMRTKQNKMNATLTNTKTQKSLERDCQLENKS